jgi:hypothetical protein
MPSCRIVPFDDGCALLDPRGRTVFLARGRTARQHCLLEAVRRGVLLVG